MILKYILLAFITIVFLAALCEAQSGGNYTIEQSVVASGGATSASGGQFALAGTIGQAVAGQQATNAPFSVHAGFWNPAQLAPTAAFVSVSGRVTTGSGRGVRNVQVKMTGADGTTRTALTGALGRFRFADVAAGETYVFTVSAKRFQFSEPIVVRSIDEDADDVFFVAVEN